MPQTINRAALLQELEAVQPGLGTGRDTVEQAGCFGFHNGRVLTYNDEVSCSLETAIKLTGAVAGRNDRSRMQGRRAHHSIGPPPCWRSHGS